LIIYIRKHEDETQTVNNNNKTGSTTENVGLMSKIHDFLVSLEQIYTIIMVIFNGYQAILFIIGIISKPLHFSKAEPQSIAVLICARNEAAVIGDLLTCIQEQNYPKELIQTFVCADHCTDNTASIARDLGATVYERSENDGIGKGYALRHLLKQIAEDYPRGFDSYLLFDADNLIPSDFFQKMNDALRYGYDVVASYRNTKNFGDSFSSACLSLWFIGECRLLFQPRNIIGQSAMVNGTGFIMNKNVIESLGEWNYLTITEDIEFSLDQMIIGHKIGYCADAEVFDEQPVSFKVSLRQRLRWAKGFIQVLNLYGKKILISIFQGNFGAMIFL